MATLIFDQNEFDDVTHDETAGEQNASLPDGSPAGDLDDDDILLSSISTLLTTLAGLGAPATAIGAARNQVLTFVDGANPALKFRLFDGADSDGADPLLDSELTPLTTTAGDDPITLVRINDTTIFGYANYSGTGERVAFALNLESIAPTATVPGGANITIVQYEAIHHPNNLTSFDEAVDLTGLVYVDAVQDVAFDDFSTAAAGQNLWNSVTDATTGIQLLFTGFQLGSDTVNTSSFAIGSNNQSIVIGDGIVVDFVKGQTPARDTDAKTLSTINFNERVEGPSGGFTLVQTGGNAANEVGAKVFAYDSSELGSAYHDGIIGGATQSIVAIEVWNGTTLVSSWVRADGATTIDGISYAFDATNDDGVILQGLLVDYRVEFHVGVVDANDTGKLDRFSVQNVSAGGAANDTFDLGDIRLGGQDADSAEVGGLIHFEDDGPTVTTTLNAAGAITHDETTGVQSAAGADDTADDLASRFTGIGTASTDMTAAYAAGSAAILTTTGSSFGQDEEGASDSFSLSLSAAGADSGLTTTDGWGIFLYQISDTLVEGRISGGSDDGKVAFAVAIDADTGYLSLAQYASLEHPDDTDPNDLVTVASSVLYAVYGVTDGDDDSANAEAVDIGASVGFLDDGPLALQPVSSSIKNAVGESVTAALDNGSPTPFSANFGSDGPFASYGGLVFTGLNGDNDGGTGWVNGDTLKDASGNALTSNKQSIYLSGFGTNVLTAYVGTDPAATGAKVFTMTLNSNGTYTMEMFAKIDDGSFDFDNFATARAGNFTWLGVSGDEYPEKDLLVTGGVPNLTEVNNDSDDLAANNQWIDPVDPDDPSAIGELLRLDFVNLGISTNRGGANISTIPTATHYDANNVGFTIMQTLAGRAVDVRISAFDVTGGLGGADIATDLTTGTLDKILAVTVISDSRLAPTGDPDGVIYLRSTGEVQTLNGVTRWVSKDTNGNVVVVWDENYDINNADEVAQNGDQAYVTVLNLEGAVSSRSYLRDKVFVSTADGFNRLEIMNAEQNGSKDAFAIGDIEVGAVGQEIDLAFNGKIVDGDGDANTIGLIGVTLTPEVLG